jgi:uncharacterized repeat protein (TIGR03803 family)
MTPSGSLTTLYSFCAQTNCTDGFAPEGVLAQAGGDFYGTTSGGGADGRGTAFDITPSGTLTALSSLCSPDLCADGPYAGLVQATNGTFYGTTVVGGTTTYICGAGCGTVFSLSVGLPPFVETQPTSGKVGTAVKILGTNLAGVSEVTFNGTAAVFGVSSNSPTEITATVPAGATTGKVRVLTPSGTLSSNVPFRVLR